MPYTIENPPEAVKGLPKHAQEIYISAFNSAFEQYKGDESRSAATAWAAVKTKFIKNAQGEWVSKESADNSLQEIYSGVLKMGSIRPGATTVRLIQELTDSVTSTLNHVDPTEYGFNFVMLESAKEALSAIEAVKTEDGAEYPASAYAYVPDSEAPSTWKLRLWEDPQKKVTKAQLGRAAAAFSPGGFRGQKVDIPAEDLAAVKRKIRSEYRKLGVEDIDMPKYVQESFRELITNFVPLTEAKVSGKDTAQVVIIKPGLNYSKERYYPPEVLARDHGIFEGVKMYADHPSAADEKNRPERSVRDWVATLKNVHVGDKGELLGEAVIVEPWMKEKLSTLRDKNMLNDMGVSINAIGAGSKSKIEGVDTTVVEKLIRARSVDFVTEAGAGGGVSLFESSRDLDVDLIGVEILKERRPDLMKQIEEAIKPEIIKEAQKAMVDEAKYKEMEEANKQLLQERDEWKGKAEAADKAKAIAETKAKLDDALLKADLPKPTKDRIAAQFKDAASDTGIAEAIKAEKDYIAQLTEAGKVKNLGGGTPPVAVTIEEKRAQWKKIHPEWSDTQVDTAIKGF